MKSPVQAPIQVAPATAAAEAVNTGVFDYTLPSGKVIKDACREDLFDAFLGDLNWIKQDLRDLIDQIDRCIIGDMKKYKKVAAKRGRIVIVRDKDLNPVDVYLQAKEVGA